MALTAILDGFRIILGVATLAIAYSLGCGVQVSDVFAWALDFKCFGPVC